MSNNHSEEPPILWEEGVSNCGGDEDMFRMMVEKFEELSFTEQMEKLFHAVMDLNYKDIKDETHKMKGPLGYYYALMCC